MSGSTLAHDPMAYRRGSEPGAVGSRFASVEAYCAALEGQRPIKKCLIANNGIYAVKAIRSIRRWAYDMFADERAVEFVVMATPEDLNANAEYIRMADQVVEVPGGSNNNNYANPPLIVEIAERWQVDAVLAGWGHASENPMLPDMLGATAGGIVFIGPSGKPMRALGDKIGSTLIAQSAGVNTIAWNGDGIRVNYKADGEIKPEVYDSANIHTVEEAVAAVARVGLPVMIKASEGGGGKGIRKVTEADAVPAAFRAVQTEIPGSPIFVMKLAPRSRHLEVQLLADQYGAAIGLSGRDCSVQRRHQKIVEEGPPVAAGPEVWKRMERAAVQLAQEVDYSNAGTVEYLFTHDGDFAFLELNPRLQVEHPVTEMITGVNLPAAQLQVAMGIPLHRIPDVRRLYGLEPLGDSRIDFDTAEQQPPNGHVIAARITAENPDAGFQPTSGSIQELNFRSTPDVWGYFSVDSSGRVHEFADSQIGHLFAWGPDREAARKNVVLALKELSIRGEIRTTIEYLAQMMQAPDFRDNNIDTSWLDQRIQQHEEIAAEGRPDTLLVATVGAAIAAHRSASGRLQEYCSFLERGQLPPDALLDVEHDVELIYDNVKYRMRVSQSSPITYTVSCNDSHASVDIRALSDGGFLVLLNGKSHVVYVKREPSALRMLMDGQTCMFTDEYDPTRLTTDSAGKLIRFLTADGAHVEQGEPYAEIEVMKMLMPLLAPEAGVVSHVLSDGAVLGPGDLLATLALDDPTKVKRAEEFDGQLPAPAQAAVDMQARPHLQLREAEAKLRDVMRGFVLPQAQYTAALADLAAALANPMLPVLELDEAISALLGRVPPGLQQALLALVAAGRAAGAVTPADAMAGLGALLDEHECAEPALRALADLYRYPNSRASAVIGGLLSEYLSVETLFATGNAREDVIYELRVQQHNELHRVFDTVRAHRALTLRNSLVVSLLQQIGEGVSDEAYAPIFKELLGLAEKQYSAVVLEAHHMQFLAAQPSFQERSLGVRAQLQAAVEAAPAGARGDVLLALLDQAVPIIDIIMALLQPAQNASETDLQHAALEVYVRRLYRAYNIEQMGVSNDGFVGATWLFREQAHAGNTATTEEDNINRVDSSHNLAGMGAAPSPRAAASGSGSGSDTDSALDIHSAGLLAPGVERHGAVACFATVDELQAQFERVMELLPAKQTGGLGPAKEEPTNVLHVMLMAAEDTGDEEALVARLTELCGSQRAALRARNMRRVTVTVYAAAAPGETPPYPAIYNFRHKNNFGEDLLVRHISAPLAFHLELKRLRNFRVRLVSTQNRTVHLYEAVPKTRAAAEAGVQASKTPARFFLRAVVRQATPTANGLDATSSAERMFMDALTTLQVVMSSAAGAGASNNHIFLNICPEAAVEPQSMEALIDDLSHRYAQILNRLRVSQIELRINAVFAPDTARTPMRLVASNPTGHVVRVHTYVETADELRPQRGVLMSVGEGGGVGELHGQEVMAPYPVVEAFGKQRQLAEAMSQTLYIYDFPELFHRALQVLWEQYAAERPHMTVAVPHQLMRHKELVVVGADGSVSDWAEGDAVTLEEREPRAGGSSDIGMVAWVINFVTPEFPPESGGRSLVVIGNDITIKAGSFGTREDRVFKLASEYSRERRLPRVYVAANSGARIGMAEEVKSKFQVAWNDPADPSRGFRYLYLSAEDHTALTESVQCERVETEDGEVRFVLKDIIGSAPDLGQENLRGSGMIAGETSTAYDEVFTLTLVLGRSVGIGAYLVRLGQRTIQKEDNSPIILTGYQALNKLMGQAVYSSNDQLGGPKIMYHNGVSHLTVPSHMRAVEACLRWLSFVPATRGGRLPVSDITGVDMVERDIDWTPPQGPYDPRHMLAGFADFDASGASVWHSGFFDRGSFEETLAGWAKTVVVGRARLGGIPVGVVVTESRTVEQRTPADPANPTSTEVVCNQAGGVWFPDSAYKTAQAIRDIQGEDLPLFIFANWRGFSGGQRDMFNEVLKYGSMIVDALVAFKQPVFVYIPPFAELRGGAWVVVDPTINAEVMEMYAACEARGNVLEPNGAAAIKFRERDMLASAHRLDDELKALDAQRAAGGLSEQDLAALDQRIGEREQALLSVYQQVAIQVADLHDTPGRMKAKGVISEVVPWQHARSFFYWRLRRRLSEFDLRTQVADAHGDLSPTEGSRHLQAWFAAAVGAGRVRSATDGSDWDNDRAVLAWMSDERDHIQAEIAQLRQQRIAARVAELGQEDPQALVQGVMDLIQQLPTVDRQVVLGKLRRGVLMGGGATY